MQVLLLLLLLGVMVLLLLLLLLAGAKGASRSLAAVPPFLTLFAYMSPSHKL